MPPVPRETFRGGSRIYQLMASLQELEWKPRKMKQIANSYMVNRYIANKMKPGIRIPSDSVFYKNLLKLPILLEQWPYRMAWMILVVENLQQEVEIENRTRTTCTAKRARRSSIEIGESLPSLLFAKIFRPLGD